ncbi:MAG TPA: hypothetical protein VHG11_10485 [Pseudorhizobium sp.]|nr:hypothetical protein [Pseudorhizobium sp.]
MIGNPIISIIAGFLLWSLIFLLLYAVQATGCHLAADSLVALEEQPTLRLVLIVSFLLSLLVVGIPFIRSRRNRNSLDHSDETKDFTREVAGYVWIAAAVATPFCFAGVMWLGLCGT